MGKFNYFDSVCFVKPHLPAWIQHVAGSVVPADVFSLEAEDMSFVGFFTTNFMFSNCITITIAMLCCVFRPFLLHFNQRLSCFPRIRSLAKQQGQNL